MQKVYTHFFYTYNKKTEKLTKHWCDILNKTSDPNLVVVKLRNNRTREVITKTLINNYDKLPPCSTTS